MVRLGLLELRGARYMCPSCYLANKRIFEWNDRCLPCGMRRRVKQWMRIPPRMKEFFLLVCPGADRICRDCYNDATLFLDEGRIRDRERSSSAWGGLRAAVDLLRRDSVEPPPTKKCRTDEFPVDLASRVSADDIIAALRGRVQSLLDHPCKESAMTHTEECIENANEWGDGLFDIMHAIFEPKATKRRGKDWTRVGIMTLLDGMLHQADNRYSATMWEMTKQLRMDGVPRRRIVGFSHAGVGMHICNIDRQDAKDQALHLSSIQTEFKDKKVMKMMVLDDFNGQHPYLLVHEDGAHAQCTVGNVILKDITDTEVDLLSAVYGDECLLPKTFSPDLFISFFDRVVGSGKICGSYMGERSPKMEEWSRVVCPYDARRIRHPHGPVTLDGVQLLLSSPGFHKDEEIEKVFRDAVQLVGLFTFDRLMPVTGDFHVFWVVFRLCRLHPEEFGHFVPIPGAFHVALNAQQAIFKWYSPVVTRLWGQVSDTIVPLPLRPLQRKNILDLLCRSWRQCRRGILNRLAKVQCGRDTVMLLHFFEEVLPVSLDIYSAFLNGDADLFDALLLRLLPIFAQFGKQNYVNALVLFIMTTEYWRTIFPDMHKKYRKAFNRFSEEEIELFHSTVHPWSHLCRDSTQLAARITVHGAMKDSMATWNEALGVPERGGGACREWVPDQERTMKRAIEDMFSAVMTVPEEPTVARGKEGWEWKSSTLGGVNDRAYPLGLQKKECLYGLRYVDMTDRKIQIGSEGLPGAALHMSGCGHEGRRGALCSACCEVVRHIAVDVISALNV